MAITVLGTIYSPHGVLENTLPQYSNWLSSRYPMQLCKQEWSLSSQFHCSAINNTTLLCLKIHFYTLCPYRNKRNITELAVPWEPEKNGGKPRSRDSRILLASALHICCKGYYVCPCNSSHHDSLFAIASYAYCLSDAVHYKINSNGAKQAWLVTIASRACLTCTIHCTYHNSVQPLIQMTE